MKDVHRDLSAWGLHRVLWVGDRGFTSAENRKLLQAGGGHVLFGEKLRGVKDNAEALARPGRFATVTANITVKEAWVGDRATRRRFIIVGNPAEAVRDATTRERHLRRIETELAAIGKKSGDAKLAAEGELLAHPVLKSYLIRRNGDLGRTWWRIAGGIEDQSARPVVPARTEGAARSPREAQVVVASAPMDAWSGDITDLRSPWRGVCFTAYSILDISSRKVVGWRVEEREVDDLAVDMFERAFSIEGIPGAVHCDCGPSMRSTVLQDLLADLDVTQTFNRPHVSNDNPYSESEFTTMKYRPNYLGTLDTLEQAQDYMTWYIHWYNASHKHSGIALYSPNEVHDGTWRQAWAKRDLALAAYYDKHPERFRAWPVTPAPPGIAGINIPQNTPLPTAA